MVRLLLFFAALALAAYGLTWLADNPGEVAVTWRGVEYDVSLMVALGIVLALAIALGIVWTLIDSFSGRPSLISLAADARRREKGYLRAVARHDRGRLRRRARGAPPRRRGAQIYRRRAADQAVARASGAARRRSRRARSRRSTKCSSIRTPMRSVCAGCMSRRAGAAIIEAALDYAARAHKHAAPCPGRRRRCSTIAPRTAIGRGALADRRGERGGQADRQADRQPLARGAEDRASRRSRAERDPKGALALAQEACALAPGPRPRRGAQRPADGGARRLSPRLENPGGGLSADAASRIGRHLSAPAARRFRRRIVWPARGLWPASRRSTSRAN